MTTIVVFVSSLLMASILVLMKALELKNKKKSVFLEFISRLDPVLDSLVITLKFKVIRLIESTRYLIQTKIKEAIKSLVYRLQERILDEYKARREIIMGHKKIINNGSASFYLRKITEYKGNGRGKIEESL